MRKCNGSVWRTLGKSCQLILVALLVARCSGLRSNRDVESAPTEVNAQDKKVENLTNALSRAQSRIEELDAKLSALTDKVDSTRLTLDNITGSKAIKTEPVGSVKAEHTEQPEVKHANATENKMLLKMDGAISDFSKAMTLFKSGKYTDAETAFNHFTEKYPEHVLAGSAQFYTGESYLMMGEFKLAANEYSKVLSSFASSPRAATAMVRLAHCAEATGNTAEAEKTMALASELYAGNPSLDLSHPGKNPGLAHGAKLDSKSEQHATAPTTHTKKDLDAGPIEPSKHDDSKIDDLEEKH